MSQRSDRPGQRDIARLAGVSQAVVSVVLTGKAETKRITPGIQEKVRAAATQLGYVPDVAARSLRGGRNGLLGVHTFERVFPVRADDYYHEFLAGIEEKAVELGQDLVLFSSTQRPDGTRSIYANGSNRLRLADGAIILGLERNDAELERLAAEGYPFVFIGRRDVPGTSAPYVAADYPAAVAGAVRALADLGHRQVAYVGNDVRRAPQEERRTAFAEHGRRSGLAPQPDALTTPDQITTDWLAGQLGNGVTALVAETFELAEAVAEAAKRHGCEVPAELSVVCLDSPPTGSVVAGWSYTAIPRREMGARSIALLLALLDGALPAGHVEVIACDPLTEGSVAPAPHR
ncbi:MAG: DNA-binding transcriptional regulator, LacI/PurR family [Actinomycetia bacterium]|nr:DNA-binding transcriptional regulator, LacI/PurR family [Actinomycetes bacterium]